MGADYPNDNVAILNSMNMDGSSKPLCQPILFSDASAVLRGSPPANVAWV
jgi:hypothetical protein